MMSEESTPRRFEIGDRYRPSQISPKGTVVVRYARPYGYHDQMSTKSPCCSRERRLSVEDVLYDMNHGLPGGPSVRCGGCSWIYRVRLINTVTGEPAQPRDSRSLIRAEWESVGPPPGGGNGVPRTRYY